MQSTNKHSEKAAAALTLPVMASVDHHGLIKTAAAEQVVAPIACQLCYLVLLCENAEETEQFTQLEGVAHAVAKATKTMAAVAARQMDESKDEVMQLEMSSLLESVMVSGQHVLLAAHKLNIQPGLAEHREEIISAAQNVMLGVVKVLIVDDDATVCTILAAAEQALQCLHVLGSSLDITSLLRSFQHFSDALLLLNHLTVERATSLQDPTQTRQLLDSLETLTKCVSMLHTAMCTTIKHPASEQAQEAKRYILDKVERTVKDIIGTLTSECHRGSLGRCGFYTEGRNALLQLLANPAACSMREAGLDSLVRDIVLHCMLVANSSHREFQQKVVGHCRHVLQFWSDITRILKFSENPDSSKQPLENFCTLLTNQLQMLDRVLMTTVLYQVLDTFLSASITFDELVHDVTTQVLNVDSITELDMGFAHPLLEDLICQTDRIINVANFISAIAADTKNLENVENSRTCLLRVKAGIASLLLELTDNTKLQTAQMLLELCQRWEEETSLLQEALSDIMDVREFTSIAIHEMVNDRHGCDEAYREQSCKQFKQHANYFICHMKQVVHSVKRHLDRSDNPIYRNGLLVLLKQAQASQTKVVQSVRDMLAGSRLNVDVYSTFSDAVSTAIQNFKVLREGLDGYQHPHILSPLRKEARRSLVCDLPLSVKETDDLHLDRNVSSDEFPVLEDVEIGFGTEHETEDSEGEISEAYPAYKYDTGDTQIPACEEQNTIHQPVEFDLLPLLYEVVAVTKGKDVTRLNQACTSVLELSNCYAQAAKEASPAVDVGKSQTLDSCRAQLVSLTPLLVQTAEETAMSSGMSTDGIYKHSVIFSDLIKNIRKILLPLAGTWFYAINTMLRNHEPKMASIVAKQLSEVMSLCAEVVQLLTSSDITTHNDGQESFNVLHNKLNKAQNSARHLAEICSSVDGMSVVDQFDGPCILWALSIQILLNSLDTILGTTAMKQYNTQKKLSVLSENSLRIQEAARLTSLNFKSAYKAKQLTEYKDELKKLTETYLHNAEDLESLPNVLQLAKSEFLERNIWIKIRVLSAHLNKSNKDYTSEIQNIIDVASLAAKHTQSESRANVEQQFENASQILFENVKASAKHVEDCLNYIRDPHARANLRSINDHLSFQISDIVSRARLMVEAHPLCDPLSLEVQAQCWSAKARYVAEEISKVDGLHQEVKEKIRAGLQGCTSVDMEEVLKVPSIVKKVEIPPAPPLASYQKSPQKNRKAVETNTRTSTVPRYESALEKHEGAMSDACKEASSLAYTSLFLKQESDSWDPEDNRIVQVTRSMADKIYSMTQYLRRKGPILDKEAFVNTAREVISNCESITQFVRVIASHCLDKQCTVELALIVEQIVTISNQLNIISSVNAVTPGCKSSDEILVKNAQNLLKTVLHGVHAAETACITGLKQPEPNSDGAEAAALCFQWKRNLQIHRAHEISNQETDDLGLRKTSPNRLAPSLAPPIEVQD